MRSKASLQLMELLVMILVFALAAALCLQVFAKANEISQETARYDQAVILAKNAAEVLKATCGDAKAAQALSREDYQVEILSKTSRLPGLAEAEIHVSYEQQLLFALDTGWQEALP